jgi:alkylation response protein AidB-like acyl-CoA dehydrogenase
MMSRQQQDAAAVDTTILDQQHDLSAFRLAIRAWLDHTVPPDWVQRMVNAGEREQFDLQRWWMTERNKVGLGTPHWPRKYGGADLSLTHLIVLSEEMARANAPLDTVFSISLNHIPATLLAWGTEEQKSKYLPRIAAGEIWCQGFSEPGAGSDLASLRTRAEKRGDHYVVNGHKVWSSMASYASKCILLARTDASASKHAGISFFLLDLNTPGVDVRPIRQINDRNEFGEIFLADVKIPAENLVGPEHQGWKVAQSTLAAERGLLEFEIAERTRYALEHFYRRSLENEATWLKDTQLRREFIIAMTEFQGYRRLVRRVLKENEHGKATNTLLPSIVKLVGATWKNRLGALRVRMHGLDGQSVDGSADPSLGNPMFQFLGSYAFTIGGGTNEVMRNIISERGLGMPKG